MLQVQNAFYSLVAPTQTGTEPYLVAHSSEMADELGIAQEELSRPELAMIFSGNAELPGSRGFVLCLFTPTLTAYPAFFHTSQQYTAHWVPKIASHVCCLLQSYFATALKPSLLNGALLLVQQCSSQKVVLCSKSWAHCYGGHQFGSWAGQLGDGRAINLGEVGGASGKSWELQLKVPPHLPPHCKSPASASAARRMRHESLAATSPLCKGQRSLLQAGCLLS